jgi:uncharacterized protein
MKHTIITGVLCALCVTVSAATYSPKTVPDPKQYGQGCYVSNPDSILTPDDVEYLNRCCLLLEDSTDVELAIAVLGSIGEYEPFEFGYELFQRWGIGKAGKNTGVLITFALASRQVYINTGSGIEGVLPDATCKKIIERDMIPYFKLGDYGGGLCNGATHIYTIYTNGDAPEELLNMVSSTNRGKFAQQQTKKDDNDITPMEWGVFTVLVFLFVLPFLGIVLVQRKTQKKEDEMEQRQGCLYTMGGCALFFPFLWPSVLWFWWRSKRYRCPQCGKQHYKIISTESSKLKNGDTRKVDTWLCSKCGYQHTEINIVKKPEYSSSGYSGSSYSGSSYSGSSYSSGGSSSGSWGGGSTSGGGAGGSW